MKCRHYRPEFALSPFFSCRGHSPASAWRYTGLVGLAHSSGSLSDPARRSPAGRPRDLRGLTPQAAPAPSGHAHTPFRHGHCRLPRLGRPAFTQSVAQLLNGASHQQETFCFHKRPSNYASRAFAKKHRIAAGSWRGLQILPPADEQRKNVGGALDLAVVIQKAGPAGSRVLDGARAKPEPSAAGHARGHSAAAFPPNALISVLSRPRPGDNPSTSPDARTEEAYELRQQLSEPRGA